MISSGLSDDPPTMTGSSFTHIPLASIARTNRVSKLSISLEDVYVISTDPKPLPFMVYAFGERKTMQGVESLKVTKFKGLVVGEI
uniref:Uncharacterized protein n=1 Tax=Tanacetum cinerariifolium TaxID=118510 RepID=A0A699R7Y9_TANCI|nr:hypothetical protein [Tanacetum cinerariifolium]